MQYATLNHIYRLVWSDLHQTWVAVSELTRGQGKKATRKLSALVVVTASMVAPLAHAGPLEGQITAGSGTISQSGSTTTINQSSQNLSLNWQAFNTSASETVNFSQPSTSAIAVNRIGDQNPTQFMGKLNANGQVYLINPNGIVFGSGAQVNVGGLVASTLDISDSTASGTARTFSGTGAGSVVNKGTINTANGGYVAFVGKQVQNQGTITAPGGTAALAAGSEVTLSFTGDKLVNLQIDKSTVDTLAENGGLVQADGGAVVMSAGARDTVLASVVNNTGIVQAHSVKNVNGNIVLEAGSAGTTTNDGTLDVAGVAGGQHGGSAKVLGGSVNLTANSRIDASGDTGGGSALVGGNFKGLGTEQRATNTTVAAGSRIEADARSSGKGGQVAVWSDGATSVDGHISARGGKASGDGGSVETSGKHLTVGSNASVDTLASKGQTGDWLLDPEDFVIYSEGNSTGDIKDTDLTAALQSSNLTIKTGVTTTCSTGPTCIGHDGNGDIILANGALIGGASWTSGTTLTLSAYRNIELQGAASLDSASGTGNMILRSDNTGTSTGTVLLDRDSNVFGNASGKIQIYYNPTDYATPTDYAGLRTTYGDPLINVPDASNLKTYMYVNLATVIGDKTYDGNTTASIGSVGVRGGAPSDATIDTSGATAAFADKNVGTGKAVTVSGITLSGPGASKYALNGLESTTASISKRDLNLSGISINNKTYDGTTNATVTGSAVVSAIGGDAVAVSGSGAGSLFADKNVGTGKAVAVRGYTLSGADAGNYNLIVPTNLTADIAKARLSVTGVTANNKIYDSTTHATLSGTASVLALGGDVVMVTGTGNGTFSSKNAGGAKAVTVTGYGLSGADAGNYDIVQPAGLTATINKAGLSLAGVSVADKTYDGTTSATLSGSATVTGIAGDDVSTSGSGSASFADKNAGVNKAVTVSGYTLGGLDAGNYTLIPSGGLTASIGKLDTVLFGISANNKVYDGTSAATISGSAFVSPLGADVVTVSGSGRGSTFVDKNAGTGKAVTVRGYTLTGADAANYNLTQSMGLTADIAKANLNITGISANNKTYDSTTNATLSGTATVSALGSDAVAVTGTGIAAFSDKNAGINKAVVVAGYGLSGSDAGNYNVVQPTGLTATIDKAILALAGVSVADKTYDGTTSATLTGTAAVAGIAGDDVGITGSGSAVFADKNAAVNKAVTVSGYTLGGLDAGNYTLIPSGGLTASIAKLNTVLSGISVANKTYDGTTSATLTGSAVISPLGADVVAVSGSGAGSAFADKNAGTGKAVTVRGYSLTGADAGNYNLVQPTNLTADVARANLNVVGVTADNRTYDSTTNATLSGTAVVSALGSDVVMVTGTGSATFADKNAGSGKAITATGYGLSGADAGNYNIVQPTGLTATINKASLGVAGVLVADKTYDGTTSATLMGNASVDAFAGDDVGVTGSGSAFFADKNAGVNKAVIVSGYTLSGLDAGNYTLTPAGGLTASIAKLDTVLSGISVANKTYDGTTSATLIGSAAVSVIGADAVAVSGSGAGGVYADKNAGAGKAVTVSGYTLTGADAGNYNLVQSTGLSADIAKASLNVTGVTAINKTYDGTTAANIAGTAIVGAFAGDAVIVSAGGSASFADKNVGSGKAVLVSGYTLSGADAGNYNLVQPSGLTASISKASLVLAGLGISDKVYDGTTAATLTGAGSVSAFGGDVVSVQGSGSAVFTDKNAGANKAVNLSGYSLSGADAGNYNLVQPYGLTATVSKADLLLSGLGISNKVYDGTTAATLTGTASVSALGSDAVSLAGSGSASFADKNAGSNKAAIVSGFTLTGADAGNYNLVRPTGLTATIAKASLSVTGVAVANKTYDGTTAANVGGTATVGALGSDAVAVSGSGNASFGDKNAGAGKAVTVSGYSLIGSDAGNYNLVQPSGLTASISKASLVLAGLGISDKVYDGTSSATLSGTGSVSAFGSDVVSVTGSGSASFADKTAGANKAVNVSGYSLSGADAGNYNLVQPSGLTATISKADLLLSGLGISNKVYDGTTAATLSGTGSVSAFGSDVVSLAGSGRANFADKNAGSGKTAIVSGFTLTGVDAGNYNLVQPTGLTAAISKADLLLSGLGISNKVYDGTAAATLTGAGSVSAFGSDAVSLAGSASASFADKNAGTNKVVSVSGYSLSGTDAGNYNLVRPTGLTADIAKASLGVTGVTAVDKTYDGTIAANVIGAATVTAFGSDSVAVSGSGSASFTDKNAGNGKAVTVAGYSLSGTDAGNYNLIQPTGLTATIRKADLLLSGLGISNKVYDGTTAATLTGIGSVRAFGSDAVSLAGSGSASFADRNAGINKAVSVGGYSLSGTDAGNYNLVRPTGLTADIAKASLGVTGVTAVDKTYDGTTAATVVGAATVTAIASDSVAVSGSGSASFTDKNAGNAKAVTVTGYSLSGTDAGNYNLVQPTGLTATISKADLLLSGLGISNKVYDGTTIAALSGTGSVSALRGDLVSVTGSGSASFVDKNVGSNKAVSISGYSLTGADAGNYNLVQPASLTANISKADLLLSGLSISNKVYDGTTAATFSSAGTVQVFGSDAVSISGSGTAAFADKNVGNGKAVTVGGYTLSGADADNYSLSMPANLTANITPAALLLSGITASDKVFDGTPKANIDTGAAVLTGLVGGDAVGVDSRGAFADAAVGNDKLVNLSNGLSGRDSGNYTLTGQTTTWASITAIPPQPTETTPVVPVVSADSLQITQNAITQVQSTILPAQATNQPRALSLSSTMEVHELQQGDITSTERNANEGDTAFLNTSIGFGTQAPMLNIQNGGVQLPPVAVSVSQ